MTGWRKSSFSGTNTNCVEIGSAAGRVGVRDSKAVSGNRRYDDGTHSRHLVFEAASWQAFLISLD